MKVLAADNKLLFVNSPYTLSDVIKGLRGKKQVDWKRALGLKNRINKITPFPGSQVYVLTPPIGLTINFLPPKLYKLGLAFNAWLVRLSVKKALRRMDMNHDLIHIVGFNPGMGLANGRKYGEKTLIYHCYDEMRGADSWLRKHGIWLEEAFMKIIDGVVVASKGLYDSKKPECDECFVVKNAVNFDLFSKGFHNELPELKIIGYVGSVDHRLDYDLLQYLFTHMPDIHFVFVGRVMSQSGLAILKQYSNVSIEGAKTPDELPPYLKTFSAGIIPFVKSTFTQGIYPMKINEYLAAGLPVISTDFSDLSEFAQIISINNNKEGFLEHCRNEIANDTPEKKQARLNMAGQNTWANRAEELSAIIYQIEQKKAHR
jgi:glycosyltransferase involved in cell wall biosynthesis